MVTRLLNVTAIIFVGLATVGLARAGGITFDVLAPGVVVATAFVAVQAALGASRYQGDRILLPIAGLLSGIGLTTVARLVPALAMRQAVWITIGLAVMAGALLFPKPTLWLKRYKYTWAILGLLLVMATLVVGKDPNQSGARLWLGVGDVLFQPSELLKVLLAIFLAAYMDGKRELLSSATYRLGPLRLPPLPYLGPVVLMWGVAVLVLFGQRDLGPTFLLFGVFLAMLYVASSRPIYVGGGLALFALAGFVAVRFIHHAAVRVEIWRNPWADPQGLAYQVVQALVAVANGGIFGTGLGLGHPELIPAAHTDFPFAVLAEEIGMAGALAVLGVYLVLTFRGYAIALRARDGFRQLLVVGLTTVIALQTVIIVAGNLRLIPLTGITLPFISYGGSSLLANFLIIGLLLRVSHESEKEGAVA